MIVGAIVENTRVFQHNLLVFRRDMIGTKAGRNEKQKFVGVHVQQRLVHNNQQPFKIM